MAIPNDDKSKMSLEYGVVNTNGSTRAGHDDWLFFVILSCSFYTNKTPVLFVFKTTNLYPWERFKISPTS
jgi:hypothetical protein